MHLELLSHTTTLCYVLSQKQFLTYVAYLTVLKKHCLIATKIYRSKKRAVAFIKFFPFVEQNLATLFFLIYF